MSATPSRAARVRGEAVTHRFGARLALAPVTFEAEAPGVVAVTGANGSGKSTLLRILAGLLRPRGGSATVEVAGAAVPPRARRGVVGLASPDLAFYDEMSAAENLVFTARTRGLPDAAALVHDALAAVGLASRAADRVSGFSSGMKQRLRLAFATLHRPAVLLLDEPGSHLDEAGHAVVERLVHEQARTALVVLATNEPREVALARHRVALAGSGLGDPS